MSVRQIGNRWQIRVRIGGGARVERTLPPGSTRADAKALEALVRREQIDTAVGRPEKHLISAAIHRWVETSAKHLKSWPRDLKFRVPVLERYAGTMALGEIVELADRIKRVGRQEGLTAAAINRYVALLRHIGNLAERWGWTDLPLGRRIQLLPEQSERHVYLTAPEVEKLCRNTDPLSADMIRFAVLTGLRRGEMLALTAEQVRDGVILLDAQTKSGRPRAIPLPAQAAAIARKRLPWGIHYSLLRARFLEARSAAGLEHVRWHDLRHTYASWLVQGGQPLTAVRDLLGHSSLAVTNRYAHLAPAHLRAAVNSLPKLGKVGKGWGKKIPRVSA